MIITNKTSHQTNTNKTPTINRKILFSLVVIAIITLITVIYISLYVQVSNKNFRIEKLKEEKRLLENQRSRVELQMARMRSIERIENVAINQLEMQRADTVEYLVLVDEQNEVDESQSQTELSERSLGDYLIAPFVWFKNLTSVEAGEVD